MQAKQRLYELKLFLLLASITKTTIAYVKIGHLINVSKTTLTLAVVILMLAEEL